MKQLAVLLVLAVPLSSRADTRIVAMTDRDDAAALVVELAVRGAEIATTEPPRGELRFDRVAFAQRAATGAQARAAIWIEPGPDRAVCVVSADGADYRRAPLPDGASPRVFATIAISLLDELLVPPAEPPHVHISVDVSPAGDLAVHAAGPARPDVPRMMIDGGAFVASRGMTFRTYSGGTPPPAYPAAGLHGLQVSASAYPMPVRGIAMTGLGVSFKAAKALGGSITVMDDSGSGDYLVEHSDIDVGVHYRYPIEGIAFQAGIDYGVQTMSLVDLPSSIDLPDTRYTHLGVGGRLDFGIGDRASLGFEARYLVIRSTGDVANADWYGQNAADAYTAGADVIVALPGALYARGELGYRRTRLTFDGSGAEAMTHHVSQLDDEITTASAGLGMRF